MKKLFGFLLIALLAGTTGAFADGLATDWQLGLQGAASPTAERIGDFHNMMLYIITAIVIFVLVLLLYVMVRFNSRVNPKPAKFTHNVLIEVIWTVVPVVILIIIAIPSFKLLYYADRTAEPEMTLEMTGYQWYWGYAYPDNEGINFMSYMLPEDEIDTSKGQKRLLSTDNPVVLPIDTDIQLLVKSADVIHAVAVPSLGIKLDAVPGRTNETWMHINEPGTYYGQCSELCGKDHSFMPIEIKAVTKEEFKAWVQRAKLEFSSLQTLSNTQLAYAETK